jgi:hypothetical protein
MTLGANPASACPKMWDFFLSHLNIKSILDLSGDSQASDFFQQRCEVKRLFAPSASLLQGLTDVFDAAWIEYDGDTEDLASTCSRNCCKYVFFTPTRHETSYWCYWFNQYGLELSPKLTRMARTVASLEDHKNNFAQKGLVFVPRTDFSLKTDAVLTWASGKDFCKLPSLKVFVNSLNSCGFNGDKLVFTHDMEIEFREYLEDRGFKVIDVLPSEVNLVVRDRFLAWHRHLCKVSYRYVMLMDFKDVCFQRNPIEYLAKSQQTGLWFVSEGKLHEDCDWNSKDQAVLQNYSLKPKNFVVPDTVWKKWDVICGGTILGLADSVKNLILSVWSMNVGTHCTDQAVLNYIYHTFYHLENNVAVADPQFCPLVVTADLPSKPSPTYSHGRIYHSLLDEQYYVWHQWDRTPYARWILELFG